MSTPANEIICYGQSIHRTCTQEWYETASRHAAVRTRQVRQLGFRAVSEGMGEQVTQVGRVKMTLVHISYPEGGYDNLPPVRIER